MTTKQKQNITRFKAVQAEAKKLKAKNKNLSHIDAVKQAWAILYSKDKKSPSKTSEKRKVGALPIGFTGKILGVPFKVVNQFDIYGDVNLQFENTKTGKIFLSITNDNNIEIQTIDTYDYIIKESKTGEFTYAQGLIAAKKQNKPKFYYIDTLTFNKIKKLITQLTGEVKKYNAGIKKTTKKQPLIIVAKKSSAAKKSPLSKKSKVVKIKKTATKKSSSSGSKKLTYVGVRKLESGASRYEYKLAGMSNFKKSKETQFYEILKDNKLILGTFNVYGKTYAKLFANVKTIVSTGEKLIAPVVENLYKKIENLPLKISIKPIGKKSKHYEYIDGKNQNTTHQITEYKISL
jgi:hypothetical protein